jgi:hypothetical protein
MGMVRKHRERHGEGQPGRVEMGTVRDGQE